MYALHCIPVCRGWQNLWSKYLEEPKSLIENFFKEKLIPKPQFMPCHRSAFKEVSDWASKPFPPSLANVCGRGNHNTGFLYT